MQELTIIETRTDGRCYLDSIYVNPDNVVSIQRDHHTRQRIDEDNMPDSIQESHVFSKITVNTGQNSKTYTAVGDPERIKMSMDGRQILKG